MQSGAKICWWRGYKEKLMQSGSDATERADSREESRSRPGWYVCVVSWWAERGGVAYFHCPRRQAAVPVVRQGGHSRRSIDCTAALVSTGTHTHTQLELERSQPLAVATLRVVYLHFSVASAFHGPRPRKHR